MSPKNILWDAGHMASHKPLPSRCKPHYCMSSYDALLTILKREVCLKLLTAENMSEFVTFYVSGKPNNQCVVHKSMTLLRLNRMYIASVAAGVCFSVKTSLDLRCYIVNRLPSAFPFSLSNLTRVNFLQSQPVPREGLRLIVPTQQVTEAPPESKKENCLGCSNECLDGEIFCEECKSVVTAV